MFMEEPSVLDYVKALLKGKKMTIPGPESPRMVEEKETGSEEIVLPEQPEVPVLQVSRRKLPWRSLAALCAALMAQLGLEPPTPNARSGVIFL